MIFNIIFNLSILPHDSLKILLEPVIIFRKLIAQYVDMNA